MRNPLAFIAAHWTPRSRTIRRAVSAALLMSVAIVVTGGAVRLTGSGLGCDTWPKCSDQSLVATQEMGPHGLIEFGNRMLTYVVCAAVGWVIIASRAAEPERRGLTRLGWAQFWVVMSNGVLGGLTVLAKLNPFLVAAHFLAATALITVATVTWQRVREGDDAPRPLVGVPVRRAVIGLTGLAGALIVVGTAVTGTGEHAGDSSDIERMPFDWDTITKVHSLLAWGVVLGTAAIWAALKAADAPAVTRARARDLFVVLMSQGVIGYTQYFLDEPEGLVALHLLGSTLVWIATLRLLLATRDRGAAPEPRLPSPAEPREAPVPA